MTTYTWEEDDGGTHMTLRNRGTPTGFAAWLAPLMGFFVRRANQKDLATLKRRRARCRLGYVCDAVE